MDAIKAVDILLDKIKRDYRDDVAFVVIMGSYIYGANHESSDIDMYFHAKTERGRALEQVFIIDGIGFDFWNIPKDRLERIASHEERITSIIAEGKLVYWGSEEDLKFFNSLREKALDTSDKVRFIHKAHAQLERTYAAAFRLSLCQTLSEARKYSILTINELAYTIALLNRTTIERGRGKLLHELQQMELLPEGLPVLYEAVFTSNDIKSIADACAVLTDNTRKLVERVKDDIVKIPFKEGMDKRYEEMINFYNKIRRAASTGDSQGALFAASELTLEYEDAFSGTELKTDILPDMLEAYDADNLSLIAEAAGEHQRCAEELMGRHGVTIRKMKDFDELKRFLDSL
ncbi:MAG: hypothetical protein AB9835_06545 [Eubacteriales bacterium]